MNPPTVRLAMVSPERQAILDTLPWVKELGEQRLKHCASFSNPLTEEEADAIMARNGATSTVKPWWNGPEKATS